MKQVNIIKKLFRFSLTVQDYKLWQNVFLTRGLLFLALSLSFSSAVAQIKLKGQIFDEEMTPLFPATISLKVLKQVGTTTDIDGYFKLEIPYESIKDSIEVTYIGCIPLVVSISNFANKDSICIVLKNSTILLSEVFVSSSPPLLKNLR